MKRRKFTAKFKTKVVLEALQESKVLNDIAMKYIPLAQDCVLCRSCRTI